MSCHTKVCTRCGGTEFVDKDGIDHKTAHTGLHLGVHSLHGHPVMAVVGLTAAALGLAFPKRITCTGCGHTIKV